MKMKIWMALAIALLLGAPAFADTFTAGEVLDITGFNNAATGIFWTGSFKLGGQVGSTPFFHVSTFSVNPPNCLLCTPLVPPWTLTSFQFDSATGDLVGMAQADFSALGASAHLLTLTFLDHNNTSDIWTDVHHRKTKTGTFSYCVGANCANPNSNAPEPSTYTLLASGLLSLLVLSQRFNSKPKI